MYVNQKHAYDCLQATLANLLRVDYSTIPEFYTQYLIKKNVDKFNEEYDNYLASIGMFRIYFDVKMENGNISIPVFCTLNRLECIGILEKKDRVYTHSVLIALNNVNDKFDVELLHDPKVDSEYVIEDIIQIEMILKK